MKALHDSRNYPAFYPKILELISLNRYIVPSVGQAMMDALPFFLIFGRVPSVNLCIVFLSVILYNLNLI